jgi:hypothetical protein
MDAHELYDNSLAADKLHALEKTILQAVTKKLNAASMSM